MYVQPPIEFLKQGLVFVANAPYQKSPTQSERPIKTIAFECDTSTIILLGLYKKF